MAIYNVKAGTEQTCKEQVLVSFENRTFSTGWASKSFVAVLHNGFI